MADIDIDKLAKTFELDYKIEKGVVLSTSDKKIASYVFSLTDKKAGKPLTLIIDKDRFNAISLNIPTGNNYVSSLEISNITEVLYNKEYKFVEFISDFETTYSKLKLWWRGQFNFITYSKKK